MASGCKFMDLMQSKLYSIVDLFITADINQTANI